MIDAALLGTGGMTPLKNRFLSSACLRINGRLLVIDCGEGTQVTHRLLGWGFSTIDVFCFTHFHADHISGLPGMLLSVANANRTEPITMIGPCGLEKIARSLLIIARDLPFELKFIELNGKTFNLRVSEFNISAAPVEHTAPCFAYSVDLLRQGKFDIEKAKANDVPLKFWSPLQKGQEIEYDGRLLTPSMVLGAPRKGLKIAYCTDTRPVSDISALAEGADLFICEGLYGTDDMRAKARKNKHMVFSEAAWLAKNAGAAKMWLTHFSPALVSPKQHIRCARDIFPETTAGYDRLNKTFKFDDT